MGVRQVSEVKKHLFNLFSFYNAPELEHLGLMLAAIHHTVLQRPREVLHRDWDGPVKIYGTGGRVDHC